MLGKHDEVVSAAGADRETIHAVGVDLSNGLYPYIEFFGLGGRLMWRRLFRQRCGLVGAKSYS